jgi:hypothetical protein
MFISRAYLYTYSVPQEAVIIGDAPDLASAAPGSIRIHANLTRAQADQVIATHAVPQGLIDALRQRAEARDWTDADPMAAPTNADESVDPAPYFPARK